MRLAANAAGRPCNFRSDPLQPTHNRNGQALLQLLIQLLQLQNLHMKIRDCRSVAGVQVQLPSAITACSCAGHGKRGWCTCQLLQQRPRRAGFTGRKRVNKGNAMCEFTGSSIFAGLRCNASACQLGEKDSRNAGKNKKKGAACYFLRSERMMQGKVAVQHTSWAALKKVYEPCRKTSMHDCCSGRALQRKHSVKQDLALHSSRGKQCTLRK